MATTEATPPDGIRGETAGRRRRVGSWLLIAACLLLALQGLVEWLFPYDVVALGRLAAALGQSHVSPAFASAAWGVLAVASLVPLRWGMGGPRWALAAGLVIGSSRLAAGGSVPAIVLLLATGVASLGWQTWRDGGLALLLGTAVSIAAWDVTLTSYANLWLVCAALAAVFVWIERQHIRATDRRLFAALGERDALIADLDAKQRQLQALQRERTHMLAGIGHDLRQPLWAIRLHADSMLARQPVSPQTESLRQQLRATDDAIGMLDQFADFAAIERGTLYARPQRVNVREVIESVAAVLRSAHAHEPVTIRTHGRDAWVRIDPTQLRRIVQNLQANAVRHSLRAAPNRHSRVVAAVRPHGDGLCIDILDNGDGIERDQLERVFEPYVQLSPEDAPHGSRGLGLAIVHGLVNQLGMRIAPVRSQRGRGTRFRVVLPADLGWREGEPTAEHAPLAGRLLAVLDDDDHGRQALVGALQSAGADCVQASSFTVMQQLLRSELRFPDALVVDLDLGRPPDGIEVIVRLRDEWQLSVPALVVTGNAGARPALPPACTLLEKPAGLPILVQALEQVMTASRGTT